MPFLSQENDRDRLFISCHLMFFSSFNAAQGFSVGVNIDYIAGSISVN